jgi:redox-sensitive bicupin YhaK (pirin superfamily)
MIRVRKASDRGHFNHGWLDTYHTFSFGRYHDAGQMGFRALRVINEDFVEPGRGFGMHKHENMEIITCVLDGALSHRDSLGTGSTIRPGELQRMTAGTGIAHSEFNPSSTQPVHLYQIWLLPNREGLEPSYDQRAFPAEERHNRFQLVASPDGQDGSLSIHQDARVLLASVESDHTVRHELSPGRHAWVQVLKGAVDVNGVALRAGDGAAVSDESGLSVRSDDGAELLLFDLA